MKRETRIVQRTFFMLGIIPLGIILLFFSGCGSFRALKEFVFDKREKINDHLFVSRGWGGNSGIIVLERTVIVIDTKREGNALAFEVSERSLAFFSLG